MYSALIKLRKNLQDVVINFSAVFIFVISLVMSL